MEPPIIPTEYSHAIVKYLLNVSKPNRPKSARPSGLQSHNPNVMLFFYFLETLKLGSRRKDVPKAATVYRSPSFNRLMDVYMLAEMRFTMTSCDGEVCYSSPDTIGTLCLQEASKSDKSGRPLTSGCERKSENPVCLSTTPSAVAICSASRLCEESSVRSERSRGEFAEYCEDIRSFATHLNGRSLSAVHSGYSNIATYPLRWATTSITSSRKHALAYTQCWVTLRERHCGPACKRCLRWWCYRKAVTPM